MCSFLFSLLHHLYLFFIHLFFFPFLLPSCNFVSLPSIPNCLWLFFHFLLYSLTLSCTNMLTQSSGLMPPPFHHVLFHPPLPPPHLPTCPGPGQSRTSPLSICPFVHPLSISCSVSPSTVSFHLSLCLRGVVELHLVLLPPPFA